MIIKILYKGETLTEMRGDQKAIIPTFGHVFDDDITIEVIREDPLTNFITADRKAFITNDPKIFNCLNEEIKEDDADE